MSNLKKVLIFDIMSDIGNDLSCVEGDQLAATCESFFLPRALHPGS